MNIGKKIKTLRKDNNYTLDELSKISEIAKPTLSKYENNHNDPSTTNLIKLADVFNVSVDYLLCRDIDTQIKETGKFIMTISNDEAQLIQALRNSENKSLRLFLSSEPKRRLKLLANNRHVIDIINMFK